MTGPGAAELGLEVRPDGPAPFEQVRAQLAAGIANGRLAVGTRLPTVRALAAELELAANTVARAYRELESSGLVETRGRAGTVVSAHGDHARATVLEAAQRYAATVRDSGLGVAEATRIVTAALGAATHTDGG